MGGYQSSNAALACECALETAQKGLSIDDAAIVSGLGKVKWPGRLELISKDR